MGDGGESQRPRRIKRGRSMEGGEPRGRGIRFEMKGERPSAEGGKQRGHTGERKRRGGRVHAGGNVETLTCQEGNLEGGGPSRICIRIEPWLGQKGKQQTG